jgi:WXG100 family type VII secretion target
VEIDVHPPSLIEAADAVHRCYRTLHAQKQDLDAFLARLRSTWRSASGESWQQVQDEWNRSADDTYAVLLGLYAALTGAHDNYLSAERHLQQLWS